jgi:hypothetical protein
MKDYKQNYIRIDFHEDKITQHSNFSIFIKSEKKEEVLERIKEIKEETQELIKKGIFDYAHEPYESFTNKVEELEDIYYTETMDKVYKFDISEI